MEASLSREPQPKGLGLVFWYIKIYFLITAQCLKARLSYRMDFFISSLGMVMTLLPGLFGIVVIFQTIPSLKGWNQEELVFLYAFSLLALCLLQIVFDNLWQLRTHVQSGTFIKYYFKPLNMLFYYTSDVIDLKGFTQLFLALGMLFWASGALELVWTPGLVLGFLVLLAGASLIMVGLLLAAASAAFWIVNSFSVIWLFSRFRDYTKYPITIYSTPFQIFFSTVVPIGFIAFYPVEWILHPDRSGPVVWLTLPVGAACFALGAFVWSRGVRSWSGTGS